MNPNEYLRPKPLPYKVTPDDEEAHIVDSIGHESPVPGWEYQMLSWLERISKGIFDTNNALQSINEGLRWQQEYFKQQSQEITEQLALRQAEAQEWQKSPQFGREVERRVNMILSERLEQMSRGLPSTGVGSELANLAVTLQGKGKKRGGATSGSKRPASDR